MVLTVLEPESLYPDTKLEQDILGPDVRILHGGGEAGIENVPDAVAAQVEGLFVFRNWLPAEQVKRFPKLKVVVRMGVGYDRLARPALAEIGAKVCNVPDYGTTEIADHAIALTLSLRRGIILHHDMQRASPPAPWAYVDSPVIARSSVQTFGVLGLGRIGTAVALRAKALGFKVIFFDPFLPNGSDLALGIGRVRSLEELMSRSDVLSIHAPQTRRTVGLVGAKELALMPKGSVIVNTARGPILDIEALYDALKEDRIAGAGLDVIPVEPPVEPVPRLLAAYRAKEPWLLGRVVVTPHSAFHTPNAWQDIRVKSAETMRDVLVDGLNTNVIAPDAD